MIVDQYGQPLTSSPATLTAFDEAFWSPDAREDSEFWSWNARRQRYDAGLKAFANTSYRDINGYAAALKERYGLYVHIRNVQSPGFRLGDFWSTYLMGGALDPDAGDGTSVPTALPIMIPQANAANDARLRVALGQLWESSNWEEGKDILTQQGSVQGDTGIEVIDDLERKKVYLKIVDPAVLKVVQKDAFGHVKGYTRQETRKHPSGNRDVTYTEIVTRDGVNVVYKTYLNDELYDWDGKGAEWSEPYGFVPMVTIQHMNVGGPWGWAALYPIWSKVMEIDDLASNLDDQIRIMLNAPMLLAGVTAPAATDQQRFRGTVTTTNPHGNVNRDIQRFLYSPNAQASAHPLVLPFDIPGTNERINTLTDEIERDAPELDMDLFNGGGDAASGRALRVRRQRVASKVRKIRRGYDKPLTRIQQMAVAIGGYRGYTGFQGFDLNSYAAGALDHRIGDRPVFDQDPLDRAEEDQAQWTVVQTAQTALGNEGALLALEQMGWAPDVLARVRSVLTAVTPEGE